MEKKFLFVFFNDGEYRCLEYLYTKNENNFEKVKEYIYNDILESGLKKKDDFSFKGLLEL